jgi:hypothetical protein
VGTIFEDSPVKLDKWFMAMWMLANCKNGVSSYEIMRELGVTQKTGWFMLQRIRAALQAGTIVRDKLSGPVQVDESFIGGKARNMHKNKREGVAKGRGHAGKGKTGVQGFFAKDKEGYSTVIAEVLEHPGGGLLCKNVRKYVLKGEEVHTDALAGYVQLSQDFIHKVVDHAETYVKDGVTTNGLENFWSLLKRSLKGTYVSVEPFHLFRYLSEQVFRFNERKDDNHGRFLNVVRGAVGKRVTWAQLTGENASLPSEA